MRVTREGVFAKRARQLANGLVLAVRALDPRTGSGSPIDPEPAGVVGEVRTWFGFVAIESVARECAARDAVHGIDPVLASVPDTLCRIESGKQRAARRWSDEACPNGRGEAGAIMRRLYALVVFEGRFLIPPQEIGRAAVGAFCLVTQEPHVGRAKACLGQEICEEQHQRNSSPA